MNPDTSHLPILRGDGTWPWSAHVDGPDIIVVNARGTCFGGANDPQDSGETASGVSTRLHPDIVGCALPLIYTGKSRSLLAALGGSPLPKIPWKTPVEITDAATGKTIIAQLIDLGPGKRTGNAIDLTMAAARLFNPRASATNFSLRCHFRIRGAAKFLSK